MAEDRFLQQELHDVYTNTVSVIAMLFTKQFGPVLHSHWHRFRPVLVIIHPEQHHHQLLHKQGARVAEVEADVALLQQPRGDKE